MWRRRNYPYGKTRDGPLLRFSTVPPQTGEKREGREGEHSGLEETREEEKREKRESVGEREGREKKGRIER